MAEANISTTCGIDSINSIAVMADTMRSLGISDIGLSTMDEMKAKTREEIEKAQKKANWSPGKAFSVLESARNEDGEKRTKLLALYKEAETLIGQCDEKLKSQLNTYFHMKNIEEEIQKKIKQIEIKEYVVLVAGETSSGKSSFINLILGENVLPCGILAVTPTICEIRYGVERKLVAYYKDDQKQPKEMILSDPNEGMSYPEQLKDYLDQQEDREHGSPFQRCELYWPHDLLKNGIVIVDSPGIGEFGVFNDVVKDHLLRAFCFVYLINSHNSGGVQQDRIIDLLESVKDQARESFLCECAVFICNKWDLIADREKNTVMQHIIKRLGSTWPNLNPQSQVVQFSTTRAEVSQQFGIISEQFLAVMGAIKTMMLRTVTARLTTEWRWLDDILLRVSCFTTTVIHSAQRDDPKEKLFRGIMILAKIENEHRIGVEILEKQFETKVNDVVARLSKYLSSSAFQDRFTSWDESNCPPMQSSWEKTGEEIEKAIWQRFATEVKEWEAENHVIEDARSSLSEQISKLRNQLLVRIRGVEDYILQDASPVIGSDGEKMSTKGKILIGALSPLWVPVALVAGILSLPVITIIVLKNTIQAAGEKRSFRKNKPAFMAKMAKNRIMYFIEENICRDLIFHCVEEVAINIKKMKKEIPWMIRAHKMVLVQLAEECRNTELDVASSSIIKTKCSNIRGELSILAINDIFQDDIKRESLDWDVTSFLGDGTFACVHEGNMKTHDEHNLKVAVKINKEAVTTQNAEQLLAEEQILRQLNHENVVKFYGRTSESQSSGVKLIFVLEFCAGNLSSFLQTHPECIPANAPENLDDVVNAMVKKAKDIATGLDHLHKLGIVHRDLKPANILIGMDNCLKIADVGISKVVSDLTGTIAGTPLYIAPEILANDICDTRADIYSFGLILWEMWYGKVVFGELASISREEFEEKIRNHYRPKVELEDCFPPIFHYQSLMRNCWKAEPLDRPNADDCIAKLEGFLAR